jgi:hypothetical protein
VEPRDRSVIAAADLAKASHYPPPSTARECRLCAVDNADLPNAWLRSVMTENSGYARRALIGSGAIQLPSRCGRRQLSRQDRTGRRPET